MAEAATGHLTGSPYHDDSLAHILTAEMLNLSTASGGWRSDGGMLLLKVHWEGLAHGSLASLGVKRVALRHPRIPSTA